MTERREVVNSGGFNVRDLGGLPTRNGRRVSHGKLFRGDFLAELTNEENDITWVREAGLKSVVDLRGDVEAHVESIEWEPYGANGVRFVLNAGELSSWYADYSGYLVHGAQSVLAVLGHVLEPANHPVLFHCTAGKDRTGTIAALVLDVLEVPREEIVEDFLLTRFAVPDIMARLSTIDHYARLLADATDEAQMPRATALQSLFAWVDARGGTSQWLVDQGIVPGVIEAFKRSMVER